MRRSSTSRWANPGHLRPRPCSPRRRGRSSVTGSGTPTPAVCSRCASGSPGTTRTGTASSVDPAALVITAGASAGFTLAFLACFDPGDRVGVVEPGYPCYRNTLLALGVEPVAIAVGPESRWAPTPELLDRAGPLDGLVVASPSNPTGTVLARERLAEVVDWCRRPRRPAHLRRDLPRHHLRAAGRERARAVERCRRGVQLLEVLLDDRLAAGLDHRAARRDGGRRAVPAEPLHLRAGALPARRRRGLRLRRGARRARGPLRPQPPGLARGPGVCRPAPTAPRPTARSTSTPTSPT